jgi:hypothetical protein
VVRTSRTAPLPIVAAIEADAKGRHERNETAWQRREEAFRAAERYPLRVALVDPHGRPSE